MASPEVKTKPGKSRTNDTWIRSSTLVLCGVGLILSLYSVYVEVLVERLPEYQALCDISPTMSCSRVFTSRWGKGFGLVELVFSKDSVLNQPNGVFGMALYTFLVFMAFQPEFPASLVQAFMCLMASAGSVYLGYILFFIIKDICVVCITIYIVNFTLLFLSVIKARRSYQFEMKKLK